MRKILKQTISIAILISIVSFAALAQKRSRISSGKSTVKSKKIGTDSQINKFFEVLFDGLDLQQKPPETDSLQFFKSNEQDILTFLKGYPVTYKEIANDLSYGERYRYIQAYYERCFIVFKLGNESNLWKNKLFSVSFNITFPNQEIAEDETKVFKKLKQLYGKNTKTEKFQYASGDESDLNLYIWKFPQITVTYRSFYDPETQKTAAIVEYWDSKFYKSYPYYDLD